MNLRKRTITIHIAAVMAILAFAGLACGKTHQDQRFTSVRIKNFGQMDDRFYRGAQPKENDFQDLKSLGIKTVFDLRDDPQFYEKGNVEALGMRYINIPMSDKDYPKAEQIDTFLKLANDPTTGKFFVHCAGGRHRTGVMGAVYRLTHDHWNYDQAYSEMKDYDFYTTWGHGPMKQFLQDYWGQIQTTPLGKAVVATQNK